MNFSYVKNGDWRFRMALASFSFLLSISAIANDRIFLSLADQCLASLAGDEDAVSQGVLCEYLDVPKELPPGHDPFGASETRILQEGVVCAGTRLEAGKRVPLLIQMEKIASRSSNEAAAPGWVEHVYPQYIYRFDKTKVSRRKLMLHEVAPWVSSNPERDTYFLWKKKKGTGLIRIKYWYGGRFLAIPYAKKEHQLRCRPVSR